MSRSVASNPLGTQYDAFLYAPVKEETNGMTLTVVSALARLGIDPWREAAELAHLPKESASRRMASTIGSLSGDPSGLEPAQKIADRLIALLPRGTRSPAQPGAESRTIFNHIPSAITFGVLIFICVMGALWDVQRLPTGAGEPLPASAPRSSLPSGSPPGLINQ